MDIIQILRNDGSIIINKNLTRQIGMYAAAIYTELITKYNWYKKENKLTNDEMFFCTVDELEKNTTLSHYQQTKAIKILENFELVFSYVKGLPAKRYFYIPTDNKTQQKVLDMLNGNSDIEEINAKKPNDFQYSKNLKTSVQKNRKQVFKKLDGNNTNINNTNTNNSFNKLKEDKTDLKKSVSQDKEISLIGNRKYKRVKRPNPNINKKQTPNKKPRTQIDRFIELSVLKIWNDCPTTSSHRLGTKVHKSISLCIKQLMQGTFYKSKSLDKDWLETLPDDYSTKEFTKKEIKETIQNLTNYSKDGFWPKEKKHYKNLLTLLYNERTGKSIFLKTFAKPPEPLKDTKQLQWPTIPEEQWVAEELKRPIFKDSERKFRDYNNKFIAFCKDFNRYYQYCLGKGTFNGTFITVRYLAKKYVQDLGFMQYDNPGSCLDIRSMYFKAFNDLIMDNVHGGNVPADLPRFK